MNEKIKGIYIFRPCLTLNTFKMRRKKNTPKSTMYLKTFKKNTQKKSPTKKQTTNIIFLFTLIMSQIHSNHRMSVCKAEKIWPIYFIHRYWHLYAKLMYLLLNLEYIYQFCCNT